jgi:hypothetical protein
MGESMYDYFVKVKGMDSKKVLAVDSDEKSTLINRLKSELKRFVIGDIASEETLERCNIKSAKLFLALTGNDITNYDAARLVNDMSGRKCNCLVQISDPKLYELFKEDKKKHAEKLKNIHVINTYRLVAYKVLEKLLEKIEADDKQINEKKFSDIIIVIAGFGKFGRMVTDILLEKALQTTKHLGDANDDKLRIPAGYGSGIENTKGVEVIVIDKNPDVEVEWESYCSISKHFHKGNSTNNKVRKGEYDYSLIEKNLEFRISQIRNTGEWEKIKRKSEGNYTKAEGNNANTSTEIKNKPVYVILATDNDFSNVSTSLYLEKEFGDNVLVITRLFKYVESLKEKQSTIESIVFSEHANKELKDKIIEINGE